VIGGEKGVGPDFFVDTHFAERVAFGPTPAKRRGERGGGPLLLGGGRIFVSAAVVFPRQKSGFAFPRGCGP